MNIVNVLKNWSPKVSKGAYDLLTFDELHDLVQVELARRNCQQSNLIALLKAMKRVSKTRHNVRTLARLAYACGCIQAIAEPTTVAPQSPMFELELLPLN